MPFLSQNKKRIVVSIMNDYKIIDTMHKVQDMIHDAIGNGGGE